MTTGLRSARTLLLACAGLLAACKVSDCPHITTASPQHPQAIRVSLRGLCEDTVCPPNPQSAIAHVMQDVAAMPQGCDARVISGCGVQSVEEFWGTHGNTWHYDSKTGLLIGGDRFMDTEEQVDNCSGLVFMAGNGRPVCAHATERSLCPEVESDAGAETDSGAP